MTQGANNGIERGLDSRYECLYGLDGFGLRGVRWVVVFTSPVAPRWQVIAILWPLVDLTRLNIESARAAIHPI